jgi:hypothetical protein
MSPESQQALEQHVQAIAKLLYEDADPSKLSTLSEIEKTVRQQLQEKVSPQIGIFYPICHQQCSRIPQNPKKYSGDSYSHQ